MKKEVLCTTFFLAVPVAIGIFFLSFLRVFFSPAYLHLVEICTQMVNHSFPAQWNIVRIWGVLLTCCLALLFSMNAFVSYVKTYMYVRQLKQTRKIPKMLKVALLHTHMKEDDIVYCVSKDFLAFCYGFARTKVIISSEVCKTLSMKELEAVLLHEKLHKDRGHVLHLAIPKIVSSSLFFVPVFSSLYTLVEYWYERQADVYAVTTQRSHRPLALAMSKFLERPAPIRVQPSFSNTCTQLRIYKLVSKTPGKSYGMYRGLILSLCISVFSLFVLFYPMKSFAQTVSFDHSQTQCETVNMCVVLCPSEIPMSVPFSRK